MDSMIEYGYIYFLEIRTTLITVFGNDFLIEKLHTHPMKLKHLPSYFSKQKKIEFQNFFWLSYKWQKKRFCYLGLLSN